MPKILHVLSQIPARTGSGVFFESIIREFQQAGYEQQAIIGLPATLGGYTFDGLQQVYPVLFETAELPFHIPGMSDVMPYESSLFSEMDESRFQQYRAAFRKQLENAFVDFQPDIIFSHHLWLVTAFLAELLQDWNLPFKKPHHCALSHGTDLRQLTLAPQLKDYVISHCIDIPTIFSLHEDQKKEIHEKYGVPVRSIKVIGNGFRSDLFHLPVYDPGGRLDPNGVRFSEKTKLIYAGKLSFSKGLRELIGALQLLDPDRFQLYIAGSGAGPEAEELLQSMKDSRVEIRYLGMLSQSALAEAFRQARIFVLPSYYEGLPLVILEALACGLKVIANDIPGFRSFLSEEILGSGVLQLLEMPPLETIDTIDPKGAADYQNRLAHAIQEMAGTSAPAILSDSPYYSCIMAFSWHEIFKKITASLQEILVLSL